MHLKTLTVRGFKSFASATTFEFEPGVTAVVGPNGSGKSNVVDALSWVMGEQGAKTLRGGKMEDVIFAGTSGRPALGRAQVSLTIDNSDGALPIEYSEVTITRTLFRAGGSEYAINGQACRLLDIQELLSDTGMGREMHVIVGQGQLDRILHATSDERRGFIEEAAGVLKHRRRREKTVRKLESMAANLSRLQDLTTEVRRQLTPLGKQAEVARWAQTVQYEVRDARSRLLADDLVTLQEALTSEVEGEQRIRARRDEVELETNRVRTRMAELEEVAARTVPALNSARETWHVLNTMQERFRSLGALAKERGRGLGEQSSIVRDPSREPDRLEAQAQRLRTDLEALKSECQGFSLALESAITRRQVAERAAAEESKRLTELMRAMADRREGLATLVGHVSSARSRVDSLEGELGRLRQSQELSRARGAEAQMKYTELEQQASGVEDSEEDLDAAHEHAELRLASCVRELDQLISREQLAERERAGLQARLDALGAAMSRNDASEEVLAAGHDGIRGRISAEINVEPGYDGAIAAALGTYAEALSARSGEEALQVLESVREKEAGRIHLIFPQASKLGSSASRTQESRREEVGQLPTDGLWAADLVGVNEGAPEGLASAISHLLCNVVVVESTDNAVGLLNAAPQLTVVTRDGVVHSTNSLVGGSGTGSSLLEQQAAIDATTVGLDDATVTYEQLRFQRSALESAQREAAEAVEAALERLYQSDARITGVAEQLATYGATVRQAAGEEERLAGQIAVATESMMKARATLDGLENRLAIYREAPAEEEPDSSVREKLEAQAVEARESELEARLALRGSEEQVKSYSGRIDSLLESAARERRNREHAERRAATRRRQVERARAVGQAIVVALERLAASLVEAAAERDRLATQREQMDEELSRIRARSAELASELAGLTHSVHRDELARARQRSRIEGLQSRALEEFGMTPEHLIDNYGPHLPVPQPKEQTDKWAALRQDVDEDGAPLPEGKAFERSDQEKRLRKAEKDLASLGKVNPLALEEFAALEERHRFLAEQLEDLKSSRKDLLDIIRDVDERVERVFTEAFHDTAEQFEQVFATLFPGGEGKLVLTDPGDMLNTGIEVQARPAGKKIKRLSLLSGGERSLTAVALLVAIFKARPSPFYVMDEVEAALDDTNLGRLLVIFRELREVSQLIIITHQKRTMEIADALYGVSMRGDGVTKVISQRL
ncbi:chromosome segregation protein SMC [Arthrobacter rhombi]|uniref:chromosome segregation protein SMC n=1 Tax=Arthrobacter rhombi TaxID=71253 RepID=UPI003FD69ED1